MNDLGAGDSRTVQCDSLKLNPGDSIKQMTVLYDIANDHPINMIAILSFNGTFLLGGTRTDLPTEQRGDEYFDQEVPLVGFWTYERVGIAGIGYVTYNKSCDPNEGLLPP